MSVQLVADLRLECAALLAVVLALYALRPFPVDDAEDAAAAGRRRDDHVDGVRGGGVEAHHLGDVPDGPEQVERVGLLQEDDEEVTGPHGERVLGGEGLESFVVPLDADQARP